MQQHECGRLTGTGRADERHGLPWEGGKTQAGNCRTCAVVRKRDVVKLYTTGESPGIDRAGSVVHGGYSVEYVEEFTQACCIECHAVGKTDCLLETCDHDAGERHKSRDLADRDQALPEQPGAEGDDG
jgi:hypothetical protein